MCLFHDYNDLFWKGLVKLWPSTDNSWKIVQSNSKKKAAIQTQNQEMLT